MRTRMPSDRLHSRQAEHNRKVMATLDGQLSACEDWLTTMAFYTALHLIEARLACRGRHLFTHLDRDDWVARDGDFRGTVSYCYFELKNQSERARYKCVPITRDEWLREIRPALENLERALLALSPVSSPPSRP